MTYSIVFFRVACESYTPLRQFTSQFSCGEDRRQRKNTGSAVVVSRAPFRVHDPHAFTLVSSSLLVFPLHSNFLHFCWIRLEHKTQQQLRQATTESGMVAISLSRWVARAKVHSSTSYSSCRNIDNFHDCTSISMIQGAPPSFVASRVLQTVTHCNGKPLNAFAHSLLFWSRGCS